MPTYEYACADCNSRWDVIKAVREYATAEFCPTCQRLAKKLISRTHFYGASDWDNAQYCPSLGTMVKSEKDRRRIARERGLEEIGNESIEKINAEKERELDRKLDEKLDEAAKQAYNELSPP